MNDFKRFFSADVIVIGVLCLLALVIFIASGEYLSATWVLGTIMYVIIARGHEMRADDSEAVIIRMSEKISELEVENVRLQKENGYLDTVKSSLEWYRDTEKTNSTRTIAELKEEIERLSAELEKASTQDTRKKPGKKKKLELSDKDVARIKTELRTAGLAQEEE